MGEMEDDGVSGPARPAGEPARPGGGGPSRRGPNLLVALAVTTAAREAALVPMLEESGTIVVQRCSTVNELVDLVRRRDSRIGAVILASDLQRLRDLVFEELAATRVPLVLLAHRHEERRWDTVPGVVLPLDATPDMVHEGLAAALRGERREPRPAAPMPGRAGAAPSATPPHPAARVVAATDGPDAGGDVAGAETRDVTIYTVASGAGSPGRTTVALGLATALGAVAPTALLDADIAGPSVGAFLDADPTRNLFLLAHANPQNERDWLHELEYNLQPLGPSSPQGTVLCGLPKLNVREGVTAAFFARALGMLGKTYRYIVIDIGAELQAQEMAIHRTALGRADQVIFVGDGSVPGLAKMRDGLEYCREQLGLDTTRFALVINGHHRAHYSREDIEWYFKQPLAALVPNDTDAAQRALATQQPLVLDRRSRAARALLELAARAHGNQIAIGANEPARGVVRPAIEDQQRREEAARRSLGANAVGEPTAAPRRVPDPQMAPAAPHGTRGNERAAGRGRKLLGRLGRAAQPASAAPAATPVGPGQAGAGETGGP